MKSVNLNFLESTGPLEAFNGTALTLAYDFSKAQSCGERLREATMCGVSRALWRGECMTSARVYCRSCINTIFLKCVLLGYDAVKFSRQINNDMEKLASSIFSVEEERRR